MASGSKTSTKKKAGKTEPSSLLNEPLKEHSEELSRANKKT